MYPGLCHDERVISFFAWFIGEVDVPTLLEYVRAFPQRDRQTGVSPPDALDDQVHQLMESQLG